MNQNAVNDKIYAFALKFVQVLSVFLVGVFFISGFLFTCSAKDMTSQVAVREWDHVIASVPGLAVWILLLWFLCRWALKNPVARKRLLLALVTAWCAAWGLLLVLFGRTVPAADSMSVYSIAEVLAAGNMEVIHPVDSYLSYYPQQIGLAAYYEGIIRLWNLLPQDLPSYHIIKCINTVWACALIFFLYRAVHLLFEDHRTDIIFLTLAGANLPLLFYTSFVYGEVPSFALFSIGLWATLLFLKGGPHIASPGRLIRLAALAAAAFAGSVLLRKNSLILVIAAVLVLVFQWFKTRRHSLLVTAVVFLACAMGILPLVQRCYELRAHNTLSSGVPAMSYFAMGMQESSRGNGWYNAFNFDTYQQSGMNTETAVALSKEAIAERLAYFQNNPSYAASFYANKFLSQWADGTYACRQATLATFGGRIGLLQQVYEGRYSGVLIFYCNAYQNLVYLGTFIFCLLALKKKTRDSFHGLPLYLCLIGVIGGFLFHMLWEANSRYIFPYGLLLLPYAAAGLGQLLTAPRPFQSKRRILTSPDQPS